MTSAGPSSMGAPPPFPFVVACGRSGTTLLRAILDSHPDVAIPPETQFILKLLRRRRRYEDRGGFKAASFVADLEWAYGLRELKLTRAEAAAALDPPPHDVMEAIRRVFAAHAARRRKSRYGNKTPVHVLSIPALARAFPEARFIHLIRDGRDVALSYRDTELRWNTLEGAALRWRRVVRRGRRDGRRLPPGRYVEVRYEDLVARPEPVTKQICAFLDLPFDPRMLRYFERADDVIEGLSRPEYFERLRLPPTVGLRDWRRDMPERDRQTFEALAGGLLEELGYERSVRPVPLRARARAAAGALRVQARRASEAATKMTARPLRHRLRRPRGVELSKP